MKTIIAGCRWIEDFDIVCQAVVDSEFDITEVVSGAAKGIDTLGENWAKANDIPVKSFPANWKNIRAKGAVIRTNKYGKYNARAGHDRNEKMVKYAKALIAIWDGESRGTGDMIKLGHKYGLQVHVFMIEEVR